MFNRALVVDDDNKVAVVISRAVKSSGLEADIAKSGRDALDMLDTTHYDVVLMDINMPGMDGFETIKHMRDQGNKTPVIIVSDRREAIDTVYGLEVGADMFITKPFDPMTIGATINALIRRSKGEYSGEDQVTKAGPFEYNTSTLRLYKNGQEIFLSGKELALMKLFMDNPNRVISKDSIRTMIWGDEILEESVIQVCINRLRKKIEDNPDQAIYIQNVRKIGYKLVVEPS